MTTVQHTHHPLRATWVLMLGSFLVVVDSTIVPVANPVIRRQFGIDHNAVLWVTSAYLLAFATCLLVGGRLGDRYGPKAMYLIGMGVFTAASVWCGMSASLEALIAARVTQGVGAALLAPQTFTAITRMFPADRRGVAMSLWGATAGAGMFVGPLIGGALVDTLGWQWIFLVNLPLGVLGLALAARFVPALPGRAQRLDVVGVLLSGVGICLIVFGLQEGGHHHWAPWSLGAIAAGVVLMAAFTVWQALSGRDPLMPLTLFRHRNFVLAMAGISLVCLTFVAFAAPLMFSLQEVRGLTPTRAALLTAPLAIATGLLAPVVGRIVDRVHPRPLVTAGFVLLAAGLYWLATEMASAAPSWRVMAALTVIGIAGAMTWEPLAVIASRTLPSDLAGAGSAVFNTARQIGAVLSSAGIAALMTHLLGHENTGQTKDAVAQAMSQSMLLPIAAAALAALTALFFVGRPLPANTPHLSSPAKVGVAP